MRRLTKKILAVPVLIVLVSAGFLSIQIGAAQSPSLALTGVGNFAVLANTYTNTGAGTVLVGDLGYTVPPAPLGRDAFSGMPSAPG